MIACGGDRRRSIPRSTHPPDANHAINCTFKKFILGPSGTTACEFLIFLINNLFGFITQKWIITNDTGTLQGSTQNVHSYENTIKREATNSADDLQTEENSPPIMARKKQIKR